MSTRPLVVRPATAADLPALLTIYNHYISNSHCTFDTQPFNVEERQPWWAQFDGDRYQCLVAEDGVRLIGYASSCPFKPKAAYETSVEISVYVAADSTARGIGRQLYDVLLPRLAQQDLHRVYAGIALPNAASIRLHESFGFSKAAHYNEVGRKFGQYWDVAWYERAL